MPEVQGRWHAHRLGTGVFEAVKVGHLAELGSWKQPAAVHSPAWQPCLACAPPQGYLLQQW